MSQPPVDADPRPAPPGHGTYQTAGDLTKHLAGIVTDNTAIVCVGNELRGDDAAGVEIARRLGDTVGWRVYDARNAPESFLMKVVAQKPDAVILVDALHFGAEPGSVRLFDAAELTGQGPSTHGPAPLAFLDVLHAMHPCRCAVLGIQPQHLDLDAPPSPPVRRAIDTVVQAFQRLARSRNAVE